MLAADIVQQHDFHFRFWYQIQMVPVYWAPVGHLWNEHWGPMDILYSLPVLSCTCGFGLIWMCEPLNQVKETVSSVSYSYSYTGFASVIFFCWVTSLGREFSTDYCLFSVLFVPFWLSYFFENISTYICRSFWSSQFRQGSEIIHFGVRNIWLIYDEIMLYAWPL